MSKNPLQKLSRDQLLELMLRQAKENEQLRMQLAELRSRPAETVVVQQPVAAAPVALDPDSVNLGFGEIGSIAEASLKLTDVFEDAQLAADIYLANVRRISGDSDRLREQAREDAEEILRHAANRADAMLREARQQADSIRQESETYWDAVSQRLQAFYGRYDPENPEEIFPAEVSVTEEEAPPLLFDDGETASAEPETAEPEAAEKFMVDKVPEEAEPEKAEPEKPAEESGKKKRTGKGFYFSEPEPERPNNTIPLYVDSGFQSRPVTAARATSSAGEGSAPFRLFSLDD